MDGNVKTPSITDDNGLDSNYIFSGPPAMIKSFKQVLITKGVPANNVLTDDWE